MPSALTIVTISPSEEKLLFLFGSKANVGMTAVTIVKASTVRIVVNFFNIFFKKFHRMFTIHCPHFQFMI